MTPLGPLASFASSFTWAIGITTYSKLSRTYSPSTVNFNRALIAFPFFVLTSVLFFAKTDLSNLDWTDWFWMCVSITTSYALGDIVFLLSTRALGVPGALAIASSYPFWSALAGYFFKDEVLKPLNWIGLWSVVSGTALVILAGTKFNKQKLIKVKVPVFDRYWVGVLLAFMASGFWALNSFSVSQGATDLSPFAANALRMACALILCPLIGLISSGFVSQKFVFFLPIKEYKRSFLVFFIESYLGSTLFCYGLVHSPLGIASSLSSLAPVITLPIAVAMGMEKLSIWKTLGIILVVVGVWGLFI